MSRLILDRVSKVINGVTVLDNVSFAVEDGEIVTLVGPFGCGHILLERVVAGVETSTSGTITVGGEPITQWSADERAAALVYRAPLELHQTVEHYLRLNPSLLRSPDLAVRRIEQVAEALGLKEMLAKPIGELSAVQNLSLQVAWAAVGKPPVILVNDLLANLDVQLHDKLRQLLNQQLRSLQTTVIYATHHALDALALSDRAVVLRDGKVEQVGSPTDIYRHPNSRFVAGYIGHPQINWVAARLGQEAGHLQAQTDEGLHLAIEGYSEDEIAPYIGREVVLGIRPEGVAVTQERLEASLPSIRGTVLANEYQGAETFLTVQTGDDKKLTARVQSICHARRGDQIVLGVDPHQVLIFDKHTEKLVSQRTSFVCH